jgi:hypothetical protein
MLHDTIGKNQCGRLWFTLCLGVILACVGGCIYVAIARVVNERRNVECAGNMRLLLNAMVAYATDHNDVLPPAKRWSDALLPYVGGKRSAFACAAARNRTCSYAMNVAAGGAKRSDIGNASHLVLLFESDTGWNAAGAIELIPSRPRHLGGDHLGVAEGGIVWSRRVRRYVNGSQEWLKQYDASTGSSVEWIPLVREQRKGHDPS